MAAAAVLQVSEIPEVGNFPPDFDAIWYTKENDPESKKHKLGSLLQFYT
jgi:hypothetical protein